MFYTFQNCQQKHFITLFERNHQFLQQSDVFEQLLPYKDDQINLLFPMKAAAAAIFLHN